MSGEEKTKGKGPSFLQDGPSLPSLDKGEHAPEGLKGRTGGVLPLAGHKARLRAVYWDMTTVTPWVESIEHDDSDPDDDVDDSWTEYILHIIVTGQTAVEAAESYGFTPDQRTLLAELQAPENNDLWLALLYGVSAADNEIVAVALSQLGNVGGEPYWSWYGYTYHVDWCACFVSWCANECGYLDSGIIPKFSSCSLGSQRFKDRSRWADRSMEPVPGIPVCLYSATGTGTMDRTAVQIMWGS